MISIYVLLNDPVSLLFCQLSHHRLPWFFPLRAGLRSSHDSVFFTSPNPPESLRTLRTDSTLSLLAGGEGMSL